MCCVSVFSPSAVMPKSQCSTSPRWITTAPESDRSTPRRCTSTSVWNQVPNPRSFTRWRIHQATSSVVVVPGVMTLFENAVSMVPQTTCISRRYAGSMAGARTS